MPWDTSFASSCDDHYNFCTLHVDGNGKRWVPSKDGSAGFDLENFAESWWLWNNECGKCNATCGLGGIAACTGMLVTQAPELAAAMAVCFSAPEVCAAFE
jgi:hypothetical protein